MNDGAITIVSNEKKTNSTLCSPEERGQDPSVYCLFFFLPPFFFLDFLT